MDTLLKDLRHALRALARNPGMAAVAVICLALGIGANATMFGVVDALMFKAPAHVTDPDGVDRIYFAYPGQGGVANRTPRTGYGTYEALRDHTPALEDVAAYWATETSIGRGDNAHAVNVVLVTASFFRTLGTGRFIASLLYNVSAHDPMSLAAAAVSLVLVAGIASYLPARRAARVDPMQALRAE